MYGACALADELKNLNPNQFILFVGGHVSALPKETLQKKRALMLFVKMRVFIVF